MPGDFWRPIGGKAPPHLPMGTAAVSHATPCLTARPTRWCNWPAPPTPEPTTPTSPSCLEIGRASTWAGPPYAHPDAGGHPQPWPPASAQAPGAKATDAPGWDAAADRRQFPLWLGDDGPQFTLLLAVDDATSAVANGCLVPRRTLAATSP